MQWNDHFQIDKAVSKDPNRINLHNVMAMRRHLVATTGEILAVVPMEEFGPEDKPGLITTDAVKAGKVKNMGSYILLCENGTAKTIDGKQFPRPDEKFPKVWHLIRSARSTKPHHRVAFSVANLVNLAKAIGADGVILNLPEKPSAAIFVEDREEFRGKAYGILMPYRIDE